MGDGEMAQGLRGFIRGPKLSYEQPHNNWLKGIKLLLLASLGTCIHMVFIFKEIGVNSKPCFNSLLVLTVQNFNTG